MQETTLNDSQVEAVHHIEGPLLVLAGAGSGKTRIVTERIAHLIRIGVPSSEILAVTFTNKAAGEMRDRIRKRTDQTVLSSTFHSLCARILRESINALDYRSDFTIYDEKDSLGLLKTCLEMLDYPTEKSTLRKIHARISSAKNDVLSPNDIAALFTEMHDKPFVDSYTLYMQKLYEYNALDFDDLLFLTATLFEKHPEILAKYQRRWSFVLIDEYQDTNAAQYTITKRLVEKHGNLCVVGDPDQSIYSWRGANINNILNFENDFPGAKVITLEQNYRSTSHILSAANDLIQHNGGRFDKRLWSSLGEGERPRVYFAQSDREEASFVLENLEEHQRKGVSLNEIVIFYRVNAQSRIYEDLLLKRDIPFELIGGVSFYQRQEIKDILAYLKLLASPSDFLAFQRIINRPKRGVGAKTIAKLQKEAEEHKLPIISLLREALAGTLGIRLSKKQTENITHFLHIIDELTLSTAPLPELIREVIEASGYLHHLREDPDTYRDRKENLDELIRKSAELDSDASLRQFLEELTLRSNINPETHPVDTVKLMTLHSGKGLEFDVVFLVGLEEGLFPHANTRGNAEALEEERRLCYVGMTRAKKQLYLTGATHRTIWGAPRIMTPSRFINELPSEHLTFLNAQPKPCDEEEEGFAIGTLVHHKNFGKGVIQKAYTTSMGPTYDVAFHEDGTTRSLVAKYAKLSVI